MAVDYNDIASLTKSLEEQDVHTVISTLDSTAGPEPEFALIKAADASVSDEEVTRIENCACPGCGSCSGMFTANSMNSLTEAIGLSLPGNGTILATHTNRIQLFKDAAQLNQHVEADFD